MVAVVVALAVVLLTLLLRAGWAAARPAAEPSAEAAAAEAETVVRWQRIVRGACRLRQLRRLWHVLGCWLREVKLRGGNGRP